MCVQNFFSWLEGKDKSQNRVQAMNLRMETICRCLLLSWPYWASGASGGLRLEVLEICSKLGR